MPFVAVPLLGFVVPQSLPSLDEGFQYPCRNEEFPAFVYDDENFCLGTHLEGSRYIGEREAGVSWATFKTYGSGTGNKRFKWYG